MAAYNPEWPRMAASHADRLYVLGSTLVTVHRTAKLTTDPGTRAERFYRMDGWTEIGRRQDGQIIFQKALPNPGQ
jgi:hypothetical protein